MVHVTAPAKVNLYLHLTGKRSDGYHLLDTLVTFPAFGDCLHIAPSDLLTLKVDGEFAPQAGAGKDNLVLRAARMLQEQTGTRMGASITLTKNIPVGAGLGGGSADAAAALKGLNEFWTLHLPPADLLTIAAPLGADVPMCLYSEPLYAQGVGDVIQRAMGERRRAWIVLVHPRMSVLTKEIFAAIDPEMLEQCMLASRTPTAHGLQNRNHLQPIAVKRYPIIQTVLNALHETAIPAGTESCNLLAVRMTGSGACCFALFANEAEATACAIRMQQQHPQWWVKHAETVLAH